VRALSTSTGISEILGPEIGPMFSAYNPLTGIRIATNPIQRPPPAAAYAVRAMKVDRGRRIQIGSAFRPSSAAGMEAPTHPLEPVPAGPMRRKTVMDLNVQLLRDTFSAITPMSDDLAKTFYEILFERYPGVRPDSPDAPGGMNQFRRAVSPPQSDLPAPPPSD
jgi:hypothetical protein